MMQRLKNYLLGNLLKPVMKEDVITVNKGIMSLGGVVITPDELKQLNAEAKTLEKFRIWSIMMNSIRHVAEDKIINKSTNFEHVMSGKMMLFNIDTLQSIVDILKNKT